MSSSIRRTARGAVAPLLALAFLLLPLLPAAAGGSGERQTGEEEQPGQIAPANQMESPEREEANAPEQLQTDNAEPSPEGGANTSETVVPEPAPVFEGFSGTAGMPDPLFYPLGWSADGAFGYMTLRGDPGRGGFSARLHLVNLITDQSIAERREIDWDHEELLDLIFPEDAALVVEYFLRLWAPLIAEAGIDIDPDLASTFERLPIVRDGVSYFSQFDVVYGGEDEFLDNIEAYDFWLRADNTTVKRVYSASPRAVAVGASGYFMSPYEPRVAIVLIETRYTFEGNEPFVVLTGSNMAAGFVPAE